MYFSKNIHALIAHLLPTNSIHYLETNLNKTIEQLEKKYLEIPKEESYLITTCLSLRKKPLGDFDIEDLRIMIGQNSGLIYLIPLAIKALENNILAEGDFYKGDLLKSVLTSDNEFWKNNKLLWEKIIAVFEKNQNILNEANLGWEIRKELFLAFENFKEINS